MPSPPLSRSSSANGSSMTEGTAFEDIGEDTLGDKGTSGSLKSPTESKRTSKDSKGNVLVSVRVRPDSGGDGGKGAEGEWMVDGRKSLISYKGKEGGDYRYDSVFSPHDNNSRVYDSAAKRLVRRVMEGYHGTVFAYGMTGTGKTFSMQGTANSPGVIPLAITDIFSYIRENPGREFLLRVSYLEIYNEKIFDLLSQSTPGQVQQEEIKLREDSKRGVYATPLKEEIVQSPNQLLRVIARGDLARRTGSTQFNSRSSRSHAVVQIVVESRERTQNSDPRAEKEGRRGDQILPGGVLVSTLSLIDLAGSEKAAENKERRTEGAHINKSLLTLGTVIARLSGEDEKEDGTKSVVDKEKALKHLPYRDSKLTRLLQPALSGDSLVSILCTIQLSTAGTSAAATISHTGETLNTLKFAS
ncbi:kinesin-domain-containing protein, partial [Hortaea werneckii]